MNKPDLKRCPQCRKERLVNVARPEEVPLWKCYCGWSGETPATDAEEARGHVLELMAEHREKQLERVTDLVPRKRGLPSACQDLSHLTCPGCWCNGTLAETVPPLPGAAGHTGLYMCTSCNWQGAGKDLRPEVGETVTEAEVKRMLAEDARRGVKGKGGRDPVGKAKEDRLRTVVMRQNLDDELVWQRMRVASPRTNIVRVPGLDANSEELREKLKWYFEQHPPAPPAVGEASGG